MTHDEFEKIVQARISECTETMFCKNKEYSAGQERLHNFYAAARMNGKTPEQALWGMVTKHLVSVMDMVADTEFGIVQSRERIGEKLGDVINYMYLLEGLFEDRRAQQAGQVEHA